MTFTIARVIGNDLYPRHAEGQVLRNLDFILEHEPAFLRCRKVFVLNRIFDPDVALAARERVLSAGHEVIEIRFRGEDYARATAEPGPFGGAAYFESDAFLRLSENDRDRARLWACAPKIRYAMNVNGARNAALADGRAGSDWTILLDGSCLIGGRAFEQLYLDLTRAPFAPYVIVPMTRLQSNDLVHDILPAFDLNEEPQVVFHRLSTERFDERFPYGMRDKTSLLSTLGVPGAWSHWRRPQWLPPEITSSPDRNFYKYARTSVFRLTSSLTGQLEAKTAQGQRYRTRNKSILLTLATLDARHEAEDRLTTRTILGLLGEEDLWLREDGKESRC